MIKAIFFDMDGVLIDAKDWHYEAFNSAHFEHFGFTISPRKSLIRHLTVSLPGKNLQMLTKARGLPEQLHEFLNTLKQNYTLQITHKRCKPSFNHQYALSRLEGRRL